MKLLRKSGVLAAIDTADLEAAAAQAGRLGPSVAGIKLGLEFYMAHGAAGYRRIAGVIAKSGPAPIFLDLKFHDIPNTVAGAVRSVAPLEPLILNVHAAGGKTMMRAARDAACESADKLNLRRMKVIGVTVLTSLDGEDLDSIGLPADPHGQVERLTMLAREAGLDGVVCSGAEVARAKKLWPDGFFVVPGVRPAEASAGDQKRVVTPRQALDAGASVLVVGRPITLAEDPGAAARAIAATL